MIDVWRCLAALPPVPDTEQPHSAVLVPLYEDGRGEVHMVLTKRPDDMPTHPGDVVFPGGRLEPGESPIAGATREAWEEIGLPPGSVEVIGGLSPTTTRQRTNLIIPVVARVERPDEFTPEPREVEAIIEPSIHDLLDESRWRTEDYYGHDLWFYEFPEGILWGATAFMVREFLTYLR